MWTNINRYYSPLFDVLSFSLFLLSLVYVVFHYGQLPAEIPMHFNFSGEPDVWGGKGALVGFLILYAFMLVLLFLLNYFLMVHPKNSKDALAFINIPFIKKDELTERQIEGVRALSARMLALINVLVSLLFALIHYHMVQMALGNAGGLGASVPLITVLLVVIPFVYSWKIYRYVKGHAE